jgi:hypothetical protein
MWTLAPAEVIEKVTGVRYAPTQTWTILRQRLGWSRQRPARQGVERDEEAIGQWVARDWPRIKKGPPAGARSPSLDSRSCPTSAHPPAAIGPESGSSPTR